MTEAGKLAKYQDLKRVRISSGVIAVCIFAIDFVLSSPTFTLFVLLYVVFVLVPVALFSFKNKPKLRYVSNKILVYLVLFGVTFGFYAYDLSLASQRSELVIAAVDRYYEERGRYPGALQELVPAYLPEIPKPKITPSMFYYVQAPDNPHLMYTGLSPFERHSWSFINKEWYYID